MSRFNLTDDTPLELKEDGVYQFITTITTGPVVLNIIGADGVTYQPMTDGSFSASSDGLVELGKGFIKADIPVGDFLSMRLVRGC